MEKQYYDVFGIFGAVIEHCVLADSPDDAIQQVANEKDNTTRWKAIRVIVNGD